jgi:CubicO group peptidase (beta-lactamase class C family)
MTRFATRISILLTLCLTIWGCGGGGGGGGGQPVAPVPPWVYTTPVANGDGWEVASLGDEGMNEALITTMMQRVHDRIYFGIDSIAIIRNNKLVLSEQIRTSTGEFDNWINNQDPYRHVLHSTSKSFTSALIGIAIDQGHIASTQVPFYDLFNYGAYENWDPRKAEMTLEDALTMRLGIEWDEWTLPYTDPNNDLVFLENNNTDWSKALLDLPIVNNPGTTFTYNTAATIAIGQALENATGIPMADFADQHLFYPMDITTAEWGRTPTGLPNGGSGLFLLTRDLAKFGQLFIDDGMWQGQQLISAAWVAESVAQHVDLSATFTYSDGYGFQWWLDHYRLEGHSLEAFLTSGYGGQYIFCVPDLNLVVAFTGHNYDNSEGVTNLFEMVQGFIIPSTN